MAILTLAELKSRFQVGDNPTQEDFHDLIDTIAALTGSAAPIGAAGGDLAGSLYPNPVIAAKAVTFAKMQDVPSSTLLGRFTAGSGSPESVELGSGLSMIGNQLVATSLVEGGVGSGNVSGAVNVFNSDATQLPAGDGDLVFQAPAAFGNTLPQIVRVVAVCTSSFANYQIGDEVDLRQFCLYEAPSTPMFVVSSYVSGGQVTVKVKVEYGTPGAASGAAVFDRNLTTEPALVPFASIVTARNSFYIKVYALRYEAGNGFGSLALYEPADQAVPADNAAVTFTHGFGAIPSLSTFLGFVCVTADASTGHSVGDVVPLTQVFVSGTTTPAFRTVVTSSTVRLLREAATIHVPHKTTGVATAPASTANWQLRVRAARGVNLPSVMFPAVSCQMANPMGALSYGDMLYVLHWDRHASKSFLSRVDMTTSRVTLVREYSPAALHGNVSLLRFDHGGDPVDCMMVCDSRGVRRVFLDDLTEEVLLPGDYHSWKVVAASEAGVDGENHPDLLLASADYSTSLDLAAHTAKKHVWNGSAYAASSMANINWRNLTGVGGSYSEFQSYNQTASNILFFQYNPVKRRIYMQSTASGYLFVFNLDAGQDLYSWWTGTPNAAVLNYEMALCLGGTGDTSAAAMSEHMAVEFDAVTGAERAVTFVRRGNTQLVGSVTRIPWTE